MHNLLEISDMLNRILFPFGAITIGFLAFLFHRARLTIEIEHSRFLVETLIRNTRNANEIIENLDRSYQGAILSHITDHASQSYSQEHAAEIAQRICAAIKQDSRTRFSLLKRANDLIAEAGCSEYATHRMGPERPC